MLTVEEAQGLVIAETEPLPVEECPLERGTARALAVDVISTVDLPPFDKSMMDGYAVRSTDIAGPGTTLRVLGELTAGRTFDGTVEPNTALRIMTGAPLPAGADAVVRIEDTQSVAVTAELSAEKSNGAASESVRIMLPQVRPEANVIRRGFNLHQGELVLQEGRRITPQVIGLLAEMGQGSFPTRRAPRAAVLATGDELVPPGQPLGPGQISNSNEALLLAQLRGWGCDATGLGIARDELGHLRERISAGLEADLLLMTGGVSMGTLDLVPQVLTELGVRTVFHKVQMKPGKPMWFGVRESSRPGRRSTLIFALPGNPVSTMVCSELFVRPAIARLSGSSQSVPQRLSLPLGCEHRFRDERPTFHPARVSLEGSELRVIPARWRGSSDVRPTVDANGLIAFPPGERTYSAGDVVDVIPFFDAIGLTDRGWSD